MELVAFPAQLKENGFTRLELCHFHLPSRSDSYIQEFKCSLKESGVVLQTLLIDEGDITNPDTGARDANWIEGWVESAEQLGAEAARVIAGKQPWTEETSRRSIEHLRRLAGAKPRIRIENWFDLLKTPEHVFDILDSLDGEVGLCMDFGNWSGPDKYRDLAAIAPRAETCHAKAEFFSSGGIEEEDYSKCAALARAANFTGPYVLVAGNSWQALELQTQFLTAHG
jgi:sugar phosphate isomerase/epimerase